LGSPAEVSTASSEPPVTGHATGSVRTSARRLLADRLARWIVTAGGIAIIASILAILVFILFQVRPLTSSARVDRRVEVAPPGGGPLAILGDEYRSSVVSLGSDGVARAVSVADGRVLAEKAILPAGPAGTRVVRGFDAGSHAVAATASDSGSVAVLPVAWSVSFEGNKRTVSPELGEPLTFDLGPAGSPVGVLAARLSEDHATATVAGRLPDGTLSIVRREARENPMTGEVTAGISRGSLDPAAPLSVLLVGPEQKDLIAGTSDGRLLLWSLSGAEPAPVRSATAGTSSVTALSFLLGGQALVVGGADGSIGIWFLGGRPQGTATLTRVREFPPLPHAIERIAPSTRGRSFLVLDAGGEMGLYDSTSHRTLWRGRAPLENATALAYAPKADGAFLAGSGRIALLDVEAPHPEVSLRALFGKVWYEGYPGPAHVWQSTGGTEDFEPKLSLTPLLFGTLKGTLYSLILAIPLGVLSAMYASQFLHPNLRRYIKPAVEIMAALPSVVLGFLAGLWLAPRVADFVPSLVLAVLVLPAVALLTGLVWRRLPRAFRGKFPAGIEALVAVGALAGGVWVCVAANHWFEGVAFGGDFQAWLLSATGLRYDQRNAVVVGLAMGFAVIPIIFAIAEDAFTNVPRNLVSGSLALGATRWQTVTRVVLPSASPGIFAAVMVGFGRAVGETMIVLMATGNTPIMDWSPFNGFRTLSANIAVEIPEAAIGGTLYRTLFLAALLLFLVTFVVNTAAEIVRQRLRKRYAQL
jgi:phosphate transport system permease protein